MPDLVGPPVPPALAYLWSWFIELSSARPSGGFGVAALTYPDIAAWSSLMGHAVKPWEVEALKRIDALFLVSASKSLKRDTDGRKGKPDRP